MLERLSQPTPPISLSDIKRSLGVVDDNHDRDIEDMVVAAVNVLRRWTGRELTTTEYRLSIPEFTPFVEIPFPPLASVDAVLYYDATGADTVLDPEAYQVCKFLDVPSRIVPEPLTEWPATEAGRVDAVRIEFTAGTAEAPPEARHFVRLLVRHWFDNPSAVVTGMVSKEVEFTLRSLASSLATGYYADV